jgi:hypothetical protein
MFPLSPFDLHPLPSNYFLFVSAKLSRVAVVAHPMWGEWLRTDIDTRCRGIWHRRLTPQAFVWLRVSLGAAEERQILTGDVLAAAWATLAAIERDGLTTGQLTREAIAYDSALPGDWHWWTGCPADAADWASEALLHPAGPIPRRTDRRPADATPAADVMKAVRELDLFASLE